MKKVVAVNEIGRWIGQDHPNAGLTDAEVELVRKMHEGGMPYPEIAKKFDQSKWAIGRICRFERRNQTPVGHKVVHIADDDND